MSLGFLNWEGFLECPTCDYKWFTSYPVEWSKWLYPTEMQTTHWDKHSFTIEKYAPVSENAFALDDNTRFQHYLEYMKLEIIFPGVSSSPTFNNLRTY